MSLPDLTALKNYLRVQTTAEDAALTLILASAGAVARANLQRPIESTDMTYVIEDERGSSLAIGGLHAIERRPRLYLRIPDCPVADSPAVTVTDYDGNVLVQDTDFRVELATGMIRVNDGVIFGGIFGRFPYTVTATVGLALRSDYTTVVEPAIGAAILDIAADLYRRRNPAATREDAAGGVAVMYGRQEETIPQRALDMLAPYRRPAL